MPEIKNKKSGCKFDNKAAENVEAEEVSEEEVDGWFDDFANVLIQDIIRRGINRILPF
jgi:hypothetical protein